jgi:hypothetical protein
LPISPRRSDLHLSSRSSHYFHLFLLSSLPTKWVVQAEKVRRLPSVRDTIQSTNSFASQAARPSL